MFNSPKDNSYSRFPLKKWLAELLLDSSETSDQEFSVTEEKISIHSHYVSAQIFHQESEEFLSSLVVNKTIYAKVDRMAGIINFQRPKDPNDLLNDWSHKLNSLMSLVNKTTHLIAKEEMIHNLQWNNNIVHYFVFWFICVSFFAFCGNVFEYTVLVGCEGSVIPMSYNWRKICST